MALLTYFKPDSSHRRPLQRVSGVILTLILGVVGVSLLPPLTQLRGVAGYASLHTALETLSVVIAALIAAVGWTAHRKARSGSLVVVLVASAFLGVALLDFSHALSFPGMPDFVTSNGPEKAINFWLSARILAALAILAIALLPWHLSTQNWGKFTFLLPVLAYVAGVHWLFLFHPELMPRTFIPGQGLTGLKIGFEYLIIGINIATAAVLLWRMRQPQAFNAASLFGAVVAMGLSEFFFTLYASVTDLFNLMGHVYKIVSYAYLYRALVFETVEKPYQQLREARNRLEGIIDAIPDMLWLKDAQHTYLACNPQFERIHGVKSEDLIGKTAYAVSNIDATQSQIFIDEDARVAQSGKALTIEHWLNIADTGGKCLFETIKTPLYGDNGEFIGILGLARDITARKKAENEATHLAHYDPLTALPNRRLLIDRLSQALHKSNRNHKHGALLFIDLDDFKKLNDARGHKMGDLLLQQVAQRLSSSIRESDTVARLGGDEFVVALENLDSDAVHAATQAEEFGNKLLTALREVYQLGDSPYWLTASIGLTLFKNSNESVDQLLHRADTAMYQAKTDGRNVLRLFDSTP